MISVVSPATTSTVWHAGGDPYPAMNGKPDPAKLDRLVLDTADYFRRREDEILS